MVAKTVIYFATRKTANAHVYITKGNGKVRVNNVPIDMIEPEVAREVILSPLEISGELRNKIDISVRVNGGGFMGQSYAAALERRLMDLINILSAVMQEEKSLRNLVDPVLEEENKNHIVRQSLSLRYLNKVKVSITLTVCI